VSPRTAFSSPAAPAAVGPYSQAVRSGDHVFLSGQTPIDPATGRLVETGVSGQAERCFANLAAVLAAANLTFDDVVKVNVYLTSMDDFAEMNAVYADRFAEPYPARTTVGVAALPLGARIEIEVVARVTT
jgi:2-iminobutanoate/2-iminopropanoate deaminase